MKYIFLIFMLKSCWSSIDISNIDSILENLEPQEEITNWVYFRMDFPYAEPEILSQSDSAIITNYYSESGFLVEGEPTPFYDYIIYDNGDTLVLVDNFDKLSFFLGKLESIQEVILLIKAKGEFPYSIFHSNKKSTKQFVKYKEDKKFYYLKAWEIKEEYPDDITDDTEHIRGKDVIIKISKQDCSIKVVE